MEAAARDVQAKGRLQRPGAAKAVHGKEQAAWWKLPARKRNWRQSLRGFRGFKGFKQFEAWQTAGSNALTREGCVQAKGRLQCWNADGQELGGSCREGCAGKG